MLMALFPPAAEPIDELSPGMLATVVGRVVPRDIIECPLTGDTGVYYHFAIEEWQESHAVGLPETGFWKLVEHDEAIAELYVDDGTGRALILPERARIDRGRAVKAEIIDLGILGRRARQLLIRPGDTVEVTGTVQRIDDLHDERRDYRAPALRTALSAPPGGAIVIRKLG